MRKNIVVIVAVVAISSILLLFFKQRGVNINTGYASEYDRMLGEFTANTASRLFEGKDENMCYSPVSLFASLVLVAEVTGEKACDEICNVLGVADTEKLLDIYCHIDEAIEVKEEKGYNDNSTDDDEITKPTIAESKMESSEIILSNSLWFDNGKSTKNTEKIIDNAKGKLGCEIFSCEGLESDMINRWISDATRGLINGVVTDVDEYFVVLANALYYKSNWKYNFIEEGEKEFFLKTGNKISTDFIKCEMEIMSYEETHNYTIVKVPMKDGHMVFVLPAKEKELNELLSVDGLNEILALSSNGNMDRGRVTISLPKYENQYNWGQSVNSILKGMGINKMFNSNQWEIIEDSGGKIFVSQKTSIVVDEEGVTAAAATIVENAYTEVKSEKLELEITLDHPFMYIIMKDEVPLFIGTVYNPAK